LAKLCTHQKGEEDQIDHQAIQWASATSNSSIRDDTDTVAATTGIEDIVKQALVRTNLTSQGRDTANSSHSTIIGKREE